MRGMSLIVKTVTALVSAFVLLYGIQVVLYGHGSPGGGFAGGVMLACCFILMVLAFGRDFVARFLPDPALGWGRSLGALAFVAVGLLGYMTGNFFSNFLVPAARSHGGTILLSDAAIAVMVAASLFAVFVTLSVFRPED